MGERRVPHLESHPRPGSARGVAVARRDPQQSRRRGRDDTLSSLPPTTTTSRTAWAWTIATFFGVGFIKKGSGTAASIPVILGWLFLAHHHFGPHFNLYVAVFAAIATLIGIPAATIVAREAGIEDPSLVVIDEVAGQAIAFIAAPVFGWKYALAAFILFRAFDIIKPPPVRQLERLPAGWGIMMDDVAAGALALLLLQIAAHFHLFG